METPVSEFPAADLEGIAAEAHGIFVAQRAAHIADTIRAAIDAYGHLADRCVMDRAHASARIGHLRARLAILDPEGPVL